VTLGFSSIRTRLMAATTALVLVVLGAVVWLWTDSERTQLRRQKEDEARAFSSVLAVAFMNELDDENWSQIRIAADLLLARNRDFVYVLVSDARQGGRIVAASPAEYAEQFVPDLVRTDVTARALTPSPEPRSTETWLLRDVDFEGEPRATAGERIVEVASDVRTASGDVAGTFRVGISLRAVDQAVADAATKTIGIGLVSLLVGLVGAWVLAARMTSPVRRLKDSAAQIAAGDLERRAEIERKDEIGDLAHAFNEMTQALAHSFSRLRRTLESFERFVPRKFLAVIAPEGIENIQVGVGSPRRISVLFSDIRGYTSMSEGMVPLEVFNFLNAYLARMGEAISGCGGFIDKYIGDAIMALFDDEATDGCLDAALAMRRTLRALNDERIARGLPALDIGIGIHGGEVVMGTIGFISKIESTVVGDAVNVASRIEGLTKEYGCAVLVTDSIVKGLKHRERYHLRLVEADVKLRGKAGAVALYELTEDAPPG
jgi:class 3 adenylate cyclase/HAMP domain-containing protein